MCVVVPLAFVLLRICRLVRLSTRQQMFIDVCDIVVICFYTLRNRIVFLSMRRKATDVRQLMNKFYDIVERFIINSIQKFEYFD